MCKQKLLKYATKINRDLISNNCMVKQHSTEQCKHLY